MKDNNYIIILTSLLLVFLLNSLANSIDFRFDMTAENRHSLAEETKTIIHDLDDNLFIKVYLDGDFPADFKYLQNAVHNLLSQLKEISPKNIDFEFINPNQSNSDADRMALFKQLVNQDLTPTDLEIRTAGNNSNQIIFPGALIYYKDKKEAVNFLTNTLGNTTSKNINTSVENLEYDFVSAIKHLKQNKVEKIAFLTGNGELTENEVYDVTESVAKDNFKLSYNYSIDRFNIKKFAIDSTTMQPNLSRQLALLKSYKVVVIAKPTIAFNNIDKLLIDQYIMNGGRVLWLVDGVIADMDSLRQEKSSFIALKNQLNIDDQLLKYGVRINANLIEDLRASQIPIITGYSNNIPQQEFYDWPYFPLLTSDSKHPISKGIDAVKCNFVSSIDTIKNTIKKTILLHSSKKSRLNLAPAKVSLGMLENPPATETYNKKNEPIAVLLEGNFESVFKNRIQIKQSLIKLKNESTPTKMIVVADGDIIANSISSSSKLYPLGYDPFIKYTYSGNKHFIINAIHYLCDDIGLTKLKSKELTIRLLDKSKIKRYKLLIQLINIVFPLILLLVFALFFTTIKKRKYA